MLTFDEGPHVYKWNGIVVPGVTTVLNPAYEWLQTVNPYVLERKAMIGRETHIACKYLADDELDWDSLDQAVRPYVESYAEWLAMAGVKLLLTEFQVYNPLHSYAGTEDVCFDLGGDVWDVDLKTTSAISEAVGLQVAAYSDARQRMPRCGFKGRVRRGALQLLPTGKAAKLTEFKDASDLNHFLSFLNLHRWRTKHGRI